MSTTAPEIELGMFTVTDEANEVSFVFESDEALAKFLANEDGSVVPEDYGAPYKEINMLAVVDDLLSELRDLLSRQQEPVPA